MRKIKVKFHSWAVGTIFSADAQIRGGSLGTGNYKNTDLAKRAFISLCNRLGIPRDRYEFETD